MNSDLKKVDDSSMKKRERAAIQLENENSSGKKQKIDDNTNVPGSSVTNHFANSNTNINNNYNIIIQPQNDMSNMGMYNNTIGQNMYYPGYNLPSTYNMYQNLSQTNKFYGNYYGNNANVNKNFVYQNSTLSKIVLKSSDNLLSGTSYNKSLGMTNQTKTEDKSSYDHSNKYREKKYIIKDMPELTVASYFTNKNIQTNYLKSVSKKDEEEVRANSESEIISSFTNEPDSKINSNLNANTNNLSYNTGLNMNKNFTGIPPNNIIIDTKTVAPHPGITKSINYSTVGNVITFNKQPQAIPKSTPVTPLDTLNNVKPKQEKPAPRGGFSESLQTYIQKAFEKCKTEEDRTKCQNALTKIISASLKKGDFGTRDWTKHPLPLLPSIMKESIVAKLDKSLFSDTELKNREKRKGRFELEYKEKVKTLNLENSSKNEDLLKAVKIVGTCQSLEKSYLRLTTIPDPSLLRPEFILVKSLKLLKDKWKRKEADYNYISEQFRSMRQDMTIQHIQNEFTVKVYETHARIALESHDLDQFNQCQTCLIPLYEEGLKGSDIEFMAYRILYTSLRGIRLDMDILLKDLNKKDKEFGIISKNFEISHAIKVMKALNSINYFEFFKLYKVTPNMGSSLIEPFLERYRLKSLQIIATGYFTETRINFISIKLAFDSDGECVKFLKVHKTTLSSDNKLLLCKESLTSINSCHDFAMLQLKVTNNC